MYGEYYSMKKAAELIGCHYSCLRSYVKRGLVRPTKYTHAGRGRAPMVVLPEGR